jgi:hypothetical protein
MKACPDAVDLTSDDDFECRSFWQEFGLMIGSRRTGSLCKCASNKDIVEKHRTEIQAYVTARSKGGGIITKNPHLMNKISYVANVLPDARFVLIVREIMSVVASTKVGFSKAHKGDEDYPSFIHYWPDAQLPCWSYVEDDMAKNILRKRELYRGIKRLFRTLRNKNHQGSEEPGKVFPLRKLSDFQKEHPDVSRYYPGSGFARIPESWLSLNSNALKQLAGINPERWMVVSYQNLVEDPKNTIGGILRFGKIKATALESVPPELNRKTSEKWRTNLTAEEQVIVRKQVNEKRDDYANICAAVGAELLAE